MALNLGYIELGGGGVVIRIYYDSTFQPEGDSQPLINGPRGFCLDVTNTSGKNVHLIVAGKQGSPLDVTVAQGNPVTSGAGRSRTVAEMTAAGFTTRGDVGQVSVS